MISSKVKKSILFAVVLAVFLCIGYTSVMAANYTDNLIPQMTSATTPSGIVDASYSSPNGSYAPYGVPFAAFNRTGGSGNYWYCPQVVNWISYEFPDPKKISNSSFPL